MDRRALKGQRFTLKHDTTFCGGREQVDSMIRVGTEVEVKSVGPTQLRVEVVDFPLGHLSFWVHDISLQERVSDPTPPLRLVDEQREGQTTENATVSGGNKPFTPLTPTFVVPSPDEKLWTDYPFPELGDPRGGLAPFREVTFLSYDGNKYAKIRLSNGVETEIKIGYLCRSSVIP